MSELNYNKKELKKNINKSINEIIEKKIPKFDNNDNEINEEDKEDKEDDEYDEENEYIELEKLENEFILKSNANSISCPKNHGNIWTNEEHTKIIKYLKKNNIEKNYGLFDELNIINIAKKLERTEYGVKEQIKKMIFNDYINGGLSHDKISKKFNIPETNIKLIVKLYIEKNGKKIINSIEYENNLLKLQIENIKLKKELEEIRNY